MLLLDQEATLEAIPGMLPADMNQRRKMFNTIKEILSASGQLEGECLNRLRRVERLFGLEGEILAFKATAPMRSTPPRPEHGVQAMKTMEPASDSTSKV